MKTKQKKSLCCQGEIILVWQDNRIIDRICNVCNRPVTDRALTKKPINLKLI